LSEIIKPLVFVSARAKVKADVVVMDGQNTTLKNKMMNLLLTLTNVNI
jgi:uncharacterized ParB-like nuclease family protein